MTRIDLLPGAPSVAPGVRTRAGSSPKRKRKLTRRLTRAEQDEVYGKVRDRLLKEGSKGPFGVFAIRRGGGRVFKLIGVTSPDYTVQLQQSEVLGHLIGVYDGSASLLRVLEDLQCFGGPAA